MFQPPQKEVAVFKSSEKHTLSPPLLSLTHSSLLLFVKFLSSVDKRGRETWPENHKTKCQNGSLETSHMEVDESRKPL